MFCNMIDDIVLSEDINILMFVIQDRRDSKTNDMLYV